MRGIFTLLRPLAAAAAAALFLPSCNGSVLPHGAQTIAEAPIRHPASSKIRHIVIIIQENRSFNDLFYGFPGARTTSYGYASTGKKIELQPVGLESNWDIDHSSYSFFAACNGAGQYPGTKCRMNGFNNEAWYCGHRSEPPCPNADPPYSYVPHSETKPYFFMGKHYVLADEMYASNFDASSFVSHQYIIAGQASSTVNYPYTWWGCQGGGSDAVDLVNKQRRIKGTIPLCWNNETLGREMDEAGRSWAFYTSPTDDGDGGFWSAYQNIGYVYNGPDWAKDVITPQTRFFSDVRNGKLRELTWITPTCANSDHAGCDTNHGPSWVASLVNAVGRSKYWDSTAIFIFWDDYGGWYDPAPPAMVDYDGLGIRVPMLIVSAYAKQGYVSHVHYEHGSILKFVEDTFGLPRLAASDRRANSPESDAFDFNQSPRRFQAVPSVHSADYFIHQPLDLRIPDSE